MKAVSFHGYLETTLAFYDIMRTNILVATGQNSIANAGEQTSRGIEWAGHLRLDRHWRFDANLAYTDAHYGAGFQPSPGVDASFKQVPDVPGISANLWGVWSHPRDLPIEFGAGMQYVSARKGNYTNTLPSMIMPSSMFMQRGMSIKISASMAASIILAINVSCNGRIQVTRQKSLSARRGRFPSICRHNFDFAVHQNEVTRDGQSRAILQPSRAEMVEGAHIGVIGPNGAGKTTFLRALAGLDSSPHISVAIDGQKLSDMPRSKSHG